MVDYRNDLKSVSTDSLILSRQMGKKLIGWHPKLVTELQRVLGLDGSTLILTFSFGRLVRFGRWLLLGVGSMRFVKPQSWVRVRVKIESFEDLMFQP